MWQNGCHTRTDVVPANNRRVADYNPRNIRDGIKSASGENANLQS